MKIQSAFRQAIKSYKDFPKKGVQFWDFTPLQENPLLFRKGIYEIQNHFADKEITKIAAIEAKGFVLGSALAYEMEKPLILIRKPGLIPGKINKESFVKEYGTGEYQVKADAFGKSDRVLIIYDIMAGSGATTAAINLVEQSGATVVGCAYVTELEHLHGRDELPGYDLFSLVKIQR